MARIENVNQATVTELLFVGLETLPELQITLFVMFFIIYLATVVGNILLVLTAWSDHQLHTPMYFFLSNLLVLETGYVSNVIPRLMVSCLTQVKTISLPGCCLRLYVLSFLGTTECFHLTGMSYDRYLAIFRPLPYVSLMSPRACLLLAIASWTCGFVAPSITVITTFNLAFCSLGEINHICDLTAVLRLSCEDTRFIKVTSLMLVSIVTLVPFVLTITSYVHVILTIRRIPPTAGRKKAFSTCSSHLTVVSTFYGALIIMFMAP